MIRALIIFFTLSLSISAQYYEEPYYTNFEFNIKKVEKKNEIALELTKYLRARYPEKINFKMAEKIIALSLYLDSFNLDTLVLNASLKHNLPLQRHDPYSSIRISSLLQEKIKSNMYSKDKDKVEFAAYLNDIHTEIIGQDKFPAAALELNSVKGNASWDKILKNYSVKKLAIARPQKSSDKVGIISRATHPDFVSKEKEIFQRQATVRGLMVSSNAQGVNNGIMSEVIGTVTPKSGATTFNFKRQVGSSMEASLINSEKALKVRFPKLANGYKIDVSFSNKFSNKDGDSAGAAITVMLFSMFEGLEIDKSVAMTGTISPDWKVGIVGGVASKIRGALKGNCKIVGIPTDNKEAVQDLVILYGIENLWKIQIFNLTRLEEAIDLARMDKSPKLQKAISMFKEVTKIIPKDMRFYSSSAKIKVLKSLKQILQLAPNHMSARVLHDVISGNTYLRLSFLTSVEEVNRLSADILTDEKIPDSKVKSTLKTLALYTKRVDRKVAPYASQIDKFLTGFMKLETTVKELKSKADRGISDRPLYDKFLVLKEQFTKDRELLIKYAENIDRDVKVYMKQMRDKLSGK